MQLQHYLIQIVEYMVKERIYKNMKINSHNNINKYMMIYN